MIRPRALRTRASRDASTAAGRPRAPRPWARAGLDRRTSTHPPTQGAETSTHRRSERARRRGRLEPRTDPEPAPLGSDAAARETHGGSGGDLSTPRRSGERARLSTLIELLDDPSPTV